MVTKIGSQVAAQVRDTVSSAANYVQNNKLKSAAILAAVVAGSVLVTIGARAAYTAYTQTSFAESFVDSASADLDLISKTVKAGVDTVVSHGKAGVDAVISGGKASVDAVISHGKAGVDAAIFHGKAGVDTVMASTEKVKAFGSNGISLIKEMFAKASEYTCPRVVAALNATTLEHDIFLRMKCVPTSI